MGFFYSRFKGGQRCDVPNSPTEDHSRVMEPWSDLNTGEKKRKGLKNDIIFHLGLYGIKHSLT